jgi:ABC-2 type transport system permease protein
MMTALKAEFKKIISVRSTYVLYGLAMAIVIFVCFYVVGWRAQPEMLQDPFYLSQQAIGGISFVTLFAVMVGILLMTHEYRYNTINYTLTSSNNRTKVLLSKLLIISLFSVLFGTVVWGLSPLMTLLGINAHGLELVPQQFYFWDLWWRVTFFAWGFCTMGLLLAVLIRNQIGTIVFLLIVPNSIEGILSILLKGNAVYLPFTSLANVIGETATGKSVTSLTSAALFVGYMAIGWAAALYLFLKRDAN